MFNFKTMAPLKYLWIYLKDWRNWLSHTIIGLLILAIAFYLPVLPIYRIIILLIVVTFNILRMRYSKNKLKK